MFFRSRIKFAACIISIILFLLICRLFMLQIIMGSELSAQSRIERTITEKIPASRGLIYDRDHQVLVTYEPCLTVYAYPEEIKDKKTTAYQLAPYLKKTPEQILNIFSHSNDFCVLARDIPYPTAGKLKQFDNEGIFYRVRKVPVYTQGDLAAPVLGFTGLNGQGLAGLEASYNEVLRGRAGFATVDIDGMGRPLPSTRRTYIAPVPGDSLVLTVNAGIQFLAEKELDRLMAGFHPKWATIIVMNPTTGGILALADRPTFQPAEWSHYPAKIWNSDPAVLDDVEPGSIFKIVTTAAALEEGIAEPKTRYSFPGYITVDGVRIWDWNFKKDHDRTLTWAVENSYNPVFSDLALKLGVRRFYRYVRGFGFGEPPGIDLPGAAAGILTPADKVTPVDLATMGFGQGIAVTPLQMITAACAIANGGFLPVPHLVREIIGPNRRLVRKISPPPVRQVVSRATARQVLALLRKVVTRGTGRPAAVPGYRVAGKTGTAQVAGPGGYRRGVYVSSFLGFAPYPRPRVAVLVMVDHPRGRAYYGDQVAAPAFRELTGRIMACLGIPPDARVTAERAPSRKRPAVPVTVPDLRGFPADWARSELQNRGLRAVLTGAGNIVEKETPAPLSSLYRGGLVHLVLAAPGPAAAVLLPDLAGLPIKTAGLVLAGLGLNLEPSGSGLAERQSPAAGTLVPPHSTIKAWFAPVYPWLH